MSPAIHTLRHWLYTSFVLTYLVNLLVPSPELEILSGILALGCLPISWPGATRTFQVVSVVFLTAGVSLWWISSVPWTEIPVHLTSTGLMLSLLYMLPWINNLIIAGRYERHLSRLLRTQTEHLGKLYRKTSLISYVMCLFLFFASIPLVYRVLRRSISDLPESLRHRFAGQSVLRAFAMATVWSPVEVFIVLVAGLTGVQYPSLLPWLLLFSGVMMGLDWALGWRYRRIPLKAIDSGNGDKPKWGKLVELLLVLSILILAASFTSQPLDIDFFAAITLLIPPFCLIWAWLIRRSKPYLKYNILALKRQIPELNSLMLLFLALGFFNGMVEQTAILDMMREPLLSLAKTPLLLFTLLQLSSVLAALVGVHPLVMLGLQGVLVQPLLDTINPLSLAILLLTANIASDASGPYNTTVALMSQLTREPPYRFTRWNLGFALLYSSAGTLLSWLLL